MKCSVCGMTEDGNPVHADDYEGPGKHSFKKSPAKSYADDLLVVGGGELKSTGAPDSGEFDGLMIKFDSIDLTRDRFSKSTDIFHEVGDTIPILYDHGLDATLKRRRLGKAIISKIDDAGVWVKGQLKLRDDYEKAIYNDMVVPGKAGLSSGAASHMVERKKSQTKGVQDIVSWGIAEVSITPRPTEPGAIIEVKSLSDYFDDDWDDSHDFLKSVWALKGGAGSGNFGHGGRPGEKGGSSSEGGGEKETVEPGTQRAHDAVQQVRRDLTQLSSKVASGSIKDDADLRGPLMRLSSGVSQYSSKYPAAAKVESQLDNLRQDLFKDKITVKEAEGRLDEIRSGIFKLSINDFKKSLSEDEMKAIPGSTLGTPNKPHKFEAKSDDENTCAICGKAEDDTLHDMVKAVRRPMKSLYEEKLAERVPSIWEYRSALDDVIADIAAAKATERISGATIDTTQKITEAVTEYAARVIPLMVSQVEDWAEDRGSSSVPATSCNGPDRFYLRSLPDDYHSTLQQFVTLKSQPVTGETLDQHSTRAVSAVEELAQLTTGVLDGLKSWAHRVRDKIEFRRNDPTKAGRTISAANHSKLQAAHESVGTAVTALTDVHSHIGDLIKLAQRKPGEPLTYNKEPDEDDSKALSYEEIQLMLTEAVSNTQLALTGESL